MIGETSFFNLLQEIDIASILKKPNRLVKEQSLEAKTFTAFGYLDTEIKHTSRFKHEILYMIIRRISSLMPGVDGYELCRVLKNDVKTSHIPIILLTAKAAEESIIEGLETGADDYITKPFSTRILIARIQNLIDLRRQLQQTLNRQMTLQPTKISVSAIDQEFLKDLQHVIDENLSEPEFNVDQLCRKLYMSHATLYRKIHALTGGPPTEFIRSYRLKQGAELLKKGAASVLEVAFKVGFSSANYFSKYFKKKFHQLPTEYQVTESER